MGAHLAYAIEHNKILQWGPVSNEATASYETVSSTGSSLHHPVLMCHFVLLVTLKFLTTP